LLVHQGVDDGAGGEEEERLEEGVGGEMEEGAGEVEGADGSHQQPQLATGGVGDYLLDVLLEEGYGGSGQRCETPTHTDEEGCDGAAGYEGSKAEEEEHADGDHGGRVEEGGDGGGALHGVGQPGVEAQLGGLGHRTDEEEEEDDLLHGSPGAAVEDGEVDGAGGEDHQDDGEEEADVTEAVEDDGLGGRAVCLQAGEPEIYEEEGNEAHTLPADE